MQTPYEFITGPLLYVTLIIFILGILYKLISLLLLTYKKERFIFSFLSLKYSFKSMIHWLIPYGSTAMRRRPFFSMVSFLFHISLFTAPLFFLSHVTLLQDSWSIAWIVIPDFAADVMTLIVIGSGLFFIARRLFITEIRFISTYNDYLLIVIVILPFLTGFWSFHQFYGHQAIHIIHIVSAELMLALIPFTRLGHLIFGFMTRLYMSSEFGGIKDAKDW